MGFGIVERSDSLSRLAKRFSKGPKEPQVIDLSIRHEPKQVFDLFKEYEVLRPLMVSSAQPLSSPTVGEISVGSCVTILAFGSGGRLKVTNAFGNVSGWITSTSLGEPVLREIDDSKDSKPPRTIGDIFRTNSSSSCLSNGSRASRASRAVSSSLARLRGKKKDDLGLQLTKQPHIGDMLEADGKVVVREDESMSSAKILTLTSGSFFRVLDYGKINRNRMKVSVDGKTGWVSILDKNLHEPLFGQRLH